MDSKAIGEKIAPGAENHQLRWGYYGQAHLPGAQRPDGRRFDQRHDPLTESNHAKLATEVEGLQKSFNGLNVLKRVDFEVEKTAIFHLSIQTSNWPIGTFSLAR